MHGLSRRLIGGDVHPSKPGVGLGELVHAAELVRLQARAPFELPGAMHARVRLLAGVTPPVRLEVRQPREVAPAPGEGAPVALAARRFDDDRLWGGRRGRGWRAPALLRVRR